MQCLCLISIEEQQWDVLLRSELDALRHESLAHNEVLRKSVPPLVSEACQSMQAATTVRTTAAASCHGGDQS